ncbi:PLDc N-terminal domain-containing protein [Salinimicrobium sediminilitoris]|nr:PLDc N-terminal domain-containing protein [Salinimicrobium sediminilitoris]
MYFLYEIVNSEFHGGEGMLWGMLVFFVPFVGLLAYFNLWKKYQDRKK